jgi:AGZA family xanthine/uracil permease-like MFS transporter
MSSKRYHWAAAGDVNAFFGLIIDNTANLVLLCSLLAIFGFPVEFSLRYMVPGTAIGVMVGDLLFFWLAFWLAKKTGKSDVTAMPLGIDTPSLIGMVFLVLGPAYTNALEAGLDQHAACMKTWHIGMCAILITGVVKAVLSFFSNWIHRVFPRAGLLGSLAAIALVLISFLAIPEMAAHPLVGFISLVLVLVALVARQELPFKIPGALAAVLIGTLIAYVCSGIEHVLEVKFTPEWPSPQSAILPLEWLEAFRFRWLASMQDTLPYLGFILPFAFATVIGGIDCAESAASVGDEYKSSHVIGIEAFATLLASCCGGVIQTTPYIGHPAYKAMGGRAAYALWTALFIGGAGVIGYFSYIFAYIPKEAVVPILLFIGIEITAQSYLATPRRHYAALAIACFPAIAKLITIMLKQLQATPANEELFLVVNVLAGGFILTSLIWASATARIIDRKFFSAGIFFFVGSALSMCGLMHSPLKDDQMFLPYQLFERGIMSPRQASISIQFISMYLIATILMFGLGLLLKDKAQPIETDEAYEKLL